MNRYYIDEYELGDLVTIEDTSYFGMIVDKKAADQCSPPDVGLSFMYKIHFCGEEEPDNRWLFDDALKRI